LGRGTIYLTNQWQIWRLFGLFRPLHLIMSTNDIVRHWSCSIKSCANAFFQCTHSESSQFLISCLRNKTKVNCPLSLHFFFVLLSVYGLYSPSDGDCLKNIWFSGTLHNEYWDKQLCRWGLFLESRRDGRERGILLWNYRSKVLFYWKALKRTKTIRKVVHKSFLSHMMVWEID